MNQGQLFTPTAKIGGLFNPMGTVQRYEKRTETLIYRKNGPIESYAPLSSS